MALSNTSRVPSGCGPTRRRAAILRSSSHLVSALTVAVLRTDTSSCVSAFQAPSTFRRWRPVGRLDEDAGDTPQAAQERPHHEVTGIHEEHVAPALLGGVEGRLQLVFDEGRLVGDVVLPLFLGGAGIARIRRYSSPSRWRWSRT